MASFEQIAAFEREDIVFGKVWPSLNPATPIELIPLVSESINVSNDQRSIATRDSSPGARTPRTLQSRVDGQVAVTASYEGLEFFLTCALGLEPHRLDGILMPEEVVVGEVYRHIIEVDDDLHAAGWTPGSGFIPGDGSPLGDNLIPGQRKMRRGTWYIQKGLNVWRATSMMFSGLSFQAQPTALPTFQASGLGPTIDYSPPSQPDLSSLSCPSVPLSFQDMTLSRVTGGTETPIDVSSFSLSIGDPFRPLSTRDTGTSIEEPRRPGFVPVRGGFSIPDSTDTTYLDLNITQIPFALKAEFTGPMIGSTGSFYRFTIYLPAVNLTSADADTSGPNKIVQRFQFVASTSSSVPTLFPTTFKEGPVFFEIINTNPANSLL